MREILFRAKRTDNGEWIYGDLWCNPYGKRVVCIVSPINDQGTTGGNNVDPETVGQYTGLTDCNGVRIFEGDIIKWKYLCNDHLVYRVIYEKGSAGFVTRRNVNNRDGINCYSDNVFVDDGNMCEVVGNIHDRPELLEVSE